MNPATKKAILQTALTIAPFVLLFGLLGRRAVPFKHTCGTCRKRGAERFLAVRNPHRRLHGHYRRLFCMHCWTNLVVRHPWRMRARWALDWQHSKQIFENGVPNARRRAALWP